jgi:hypothetical protein
MNSWKGHRKTEKKYQLKSLKRQPMVVKLLKSPKQLLDERFLRVKQSIPNKIVLPHHYEQNLNVGILKFSVPGLPIGHMNAMYNEDKNTATI